MHGALAGASGRKSSLASQASQASCERSEREDIAALLGKTQSVKKKPLITRKSIGFGERFSSLVSISSQVAHTMMGVSELGWPLGSEQIDPNELVDKLLNEIILTASQRPVSPVSLPFLYLPSGLEAPLHVSNIKVET